MPGGDGLARRKTVLVVEDDRATSDLLRTIVEEQGFRCVPASEGHVALELARDERPSLITLDLDLPDTDGHAVLHRLMGDERTRDIPVVVVTGYSRFLPDADGRRIAGVLEKPLGLDELPGVLRTMLAADGVR
jgi:DNA-binding response OmpR family regulator